MGFNCWNVALANKIFHIKYMNYFGKLLQFMVEFSLIKQIFLEFSIKAPTQVKLPLRC